MLRSTTRLGPLVARAAAARPSVLRPLVARQPLLLSVRSLSDGSHDDFKPQQKRAYASVEEEVHAQISKDVETHKVVVFMKGVPDAPQCGFSNAVVQVMKAEGVEFKGYNVLADPDLREGIKSYSSWPTIPQVPLRARATQPRSPSRLYGASRSPALELSRAPALSPLQVYVGGEFIGGCDTTIEMYKSGELREMLKDAGAK